MRTLITLSLCGKVVAAIGISPVLINLEPKDDKVPKKKTRVLLSIFIVGKWSVLSCVTEAASHALSRRGRKLTHLTCP